jgi:hypothetical protein
MIDAPAFEMIPLASIGPDGGRALRRLRVLLYLLNQGTKIDCWCRMAEIKSLHIGMLLRSKTVESELEFSGEFRSVGHSVW